MVPQVVYICDQYMILSDMYFATYVANINIYSFQVCTFNFFYHCSSFFCSFDPQIFFQAPALAQNPVKLARDQEAKASVWQHRLLLLD
jgi:hypothetical protein